MYLRSCFLFLIVCFISCAYGARGLEIELQHVSFPEDLRQAVPSYPSGNFPAPSPLLPHPPVYNESDTATVMLTGTQIQNSDNPVHNDFSVGGEITLSSGIQYATVFPNNAPGRYIVVNATELLSNISFAYFVYYKHPLAQYASMNPPQTNAVASFYPTGANYPNFTTGSVLMKQVNAMPAAYHSIYVSFNVYDPQNTSRQPNIPNSLLEFGVLSILNVPCAGAGIYCGTRH